MNEEIWKDIPGYEGYYQVSNLGRVKSLPRGKQWPYRQTHNNIRKIKKTNRGYFSVNLCTNNEAKWFMVHRLVAMAFIPNPNNLPCVNHKDENKTNNRVENLEWCTYKYNANYGTGIDRQKKSRAANPNNENIRRIIGEKNSKAVRAYTPNGTLVGEYKSLKEASKALNVHISSIVRHCNGRVGNNINRPIRKYRFEYVI